MASRLVELHDEVDFGGLYIYCGPSPPCLFDRYAFDLLSFELADCGLVTVGLSPGIFCLKVLSVFKVYTAVIHVTLHLLVDFLCSCCSLTVASHVRRIQARG